MYYNRGSAAEVTRKKARTHNSIKSSHKRTEDLVDVRPPHLPPVSEQRNTQALATMLDKQQRSTQALATMLDKQQRSAQALATILDKQQRSTEALATILDKPHSTGALATIQDKLQSSTGTLERLSEEAPGTEMLLEMLDEQQRDITALMSMLDSQYQVKAPVVRKVPTLPGIEIDDVCKRFGGFQAVNHLSLSVRQGEIFGLLGPNGSGKTTTINMISGLSSPTSGKIRVLGYDVRTQGRKVRQVLGCVPQETALFEELSAWHNMEYHADLFNVPRRETRARITEMLELVTLLDHKNKRVKTFSGGMKRRLALARALLHDPQVVYLDEPTLGVDVQSRRALWDYIISLREQGKTVLITTNYLEEAQELCDRIAIIDHGQLVEVDTPRRLKQRHGGRIIELVLNKPLQSIDELQLLKGVGEVEQEDARLTVVTEGEQDCLPQIINMVTRQAEVLNIELREPTLDDVFLQITGKTLRD